MSTILPQAQTAMTPGLWASTKTNIASFTSSACQGIKTVAVKIFTTLAYYGSIFKDQMVVWGQALKECIKANPQQFQYLGLGVAVTALIGIAIYCCVCRGTQPPAPQAPIIPAQAGSTVPTTAAPRPVESKQIPAIVAQQAAQRGAELKQSHQQ